MKTDYLCPHCQSHLVCCDHLILTVESEGGAQRGLLQMNVTLGDYSNVNHPSFRFKDGEMVDFFCPVCRANLKMPDINDKLIHLIMKHEDGRQYDVFFSRVAGEQSTFKIDQEDVIQQYGKDASAYVSYFTTKLKKQMNPEE
ncbi:MAG: hypothetical protein D4R67_12240 [Bacteroidetes bacterium]|nr:MAG: hypothetical protein D4R67_12240 [Bacteroidota bacterium]